MFLNKRKTDERDEHEMEQSTTAPGYAWGKSDTWFDRGEPFADV